MSPAKSVPTQKRSAGRWSIDYGASLPTLEQINVPPVHDLGLSGSGVIIAQLDAGFVLSHISLQHIPILDQWDFVHDDDSVEWEPGDHEWQHRHGSQVLSTYAGFSSGELVGPAYGASVILAMTEDTGRETPIEEDNWVADMAVERGMQVYTSAGNERNNPDWGYLTAPADGDSVVAMAAVD